MLSILLSIIGLIIASVILHFEIKRQRLSRKFKHIPSASEVPFIGSWFTLRLNHINELHKVFNEIQITPVVKMFFGPNLIFFISDPHVLQEIYTANTWSERPYFFEYFGAKHGLISSKFAEWKPVRKAANPSFSQRMIYSFIPIFVENFSALNHELETFINGPEFNFNSLSVRFGIRNILKTSFDYTDTDGEFDPKLFERYEDMVSMRIFQFYYQLEPVFYLTGLKRENQEQWKTFYSIFRKIVQRRLNAIEVDSNTNQNTAQEFYDASSDDEKFDYHKHLFLDEMIRYCRAQNFPNDAVLIENMTTIFAAGYETAALTISYAVLMMAMHPEIDCKLEKELFEHYKPGDEVNYELVKKLTYLDMVVKETLRLYPPAPLTIRENLTKTHVKKLGSLDKGTLVLVNFYNLHRWKHIWGDDADEFNPDHFLPERVAERSPYCFLPFSGGPRTCLGYQYALLNIKVGLLLILSRFKFTTQLKMKDFNYKYSITLKLLNKHMVKVQKRERK